MKQFEKYVTIKESETYDLSFVMIDLEGSKDSDVIKTLNKKVSITQTDTSKAKKLLVEKIIKLADRSEFPNVNKPITRQLLSLSSSYIASCGRIGIATNMLISEDNYKKYHVDKLNDELKLEVMFDDSVEDCIIYRVNDNSQPGLVLFQTKDRYEFLEIGYFPQNQFVKIKF